MDKAKGSLSYCLLTDTIPQATRHEAVIPAQEQPEPAGQPTIISVEQGPLTDIPGRGFSIGLVHPELGASRMAMHINVLDPGSVGPYHFHRNSENAYFILSGIALITIAGKAHRVVQDQAVFLPPGVKHSVANAGTTPLRLLEVYAPPAFDDFHEVAAGG